MRKTAATRPEPQKQQKVSFITVNHEQLVPQHLTDIFETCQLLLSLNYNRKKGISPPPPPPSPPRSRNFNYETRRARERLSRGSRVKQRAPCRTDTHCRRWVNGVWGCFCFVFLARASRQCGGGRRKEEEGEGRAMESERLMIRRS